MQAVAAGAAGDAREDLVDRGEIEDALYLGLIDRSREPAFVQNIREVDQGAGDARGRNTRDLARSASVRLHERCSTKPSCGFRERGVLTSMVPVCRIRSRIRPADRWLSRASLPAASTAAS